MTSSTAATLPPLPEPPTLEQLRGVFELISEGAHELSELRASLDDLESSGYGEGECLRHIKLERLAKTRDLTADERTEAERLEAIRERARKTSTPLSYELAGRVAVVCDEARSYGRSMIEDAEAILGRLSELTGFLEMPEGGVAEELRQRAVIYERRAAAARESAEKMRAGDDDA